MTPFTPDPGWYQAFWYGEDRCQQRPRMHPAPTLDNPALRTAAIDLRLLAAASLFLAVFAIEMAVILRAPPAPAAPPPVYIVT